jgi:DNA-binding NarL/FixJ family response regulator
MSVSETMRRIEFLLEKHAPKNSLAMDMSDAIRNTPKTQGRRRELTQSQKNEIMRLRAAGYTYEEIARAIDSTQTVVWRTIRGISRGSKVLDKR